MTHVSHRLMRPRAASSALSRLLALAATLLALGLAATAGAAAPFFLPTGAEAHNTGDPRLRTDAHGNVHAVYPVVAGRGAVYAFCPAGCEDAGRVSSVSFPTDELGVVHNAMIALDADGAPRVLLATYDSVVFGACEGDCRDGADWRYDVIHTHDGDWQLTGDAFTLDPQGRPRFLMHAYQAYLGLFAPEPGTRLFACDAADCLSAAAWTGATISEQSWVEPTFRYDARGAAHVAAVVPVDDAELVAYLRCDADCANEQVDNWPGVGLAHAYSDRYVAEIQPAVSMDLTAAGGVRLAFLGEDDSARFLAYYECDADCTAEDASGWTGLALLYGEGADDLGDGIDLALDRQDRPRLAYTVSGSILLAYCDGDCVGRSGADDWALVKAELGNEIPADDIFPYHNCTVGLWFLRQPALALAPSGLPVVAYRAEDISGGWTTPDPGKPACVAGVDMTMTRLAVLGSY